MPSHPGGPEYLSDNLGKDIVEEFEEAEHTRVARKIFNSLPVRGHMKGAKIMKQEVTATPSTSNSTQ